MGDLDEVVGVDHACQNRCGLHCHHELCELHVALPLGSKSCLESDRKAEAKVVDPADAEHATVVTNLVLVEVIELNDKES